MGNFIPVEPEKWAEMVKAAAASDYWRIEAETNHARWLRTLEENEKLRAEVERLQHLANQSEFYRSQLQKDTCRLENIQMQDAFKHYEAENARLKAEVERLRKAGDWQPIETAPKDGKTTILVVEYGFVYVGIFHNDGYCQDMTGAGLDPTHWMHLPTAPAEEGKQS